ncbi:hypothetical protein [Sphingopyxis panaciterrae]
MLEFSCYNWNARKLDFPGVVIDDEIAISNLFALFRNALELDRAPLTGAAPNAKGA